MNQSDNGVSKSMDWQLNHSLSECTSHLYMNEHMSDVTVVLTSVVPSRRVPAHRFLLAIRSPVFEAMFYGALQEVKMEVTLSDVPVDGFLTFLRFLYTDVAEIQTDNAMECLQVGHMYRVPGFVKKCETILMSSIDEDNVLHLLETSIIFDIQKLRMQCMEYININALPVIKSKAFVSLSTDALKMIVGESSLQAPELEIYKAVNSWADKACERGSVQPSHENKRTFLGDAFSKLRLGHIPQSDFATVVTIGNLLSKEEMLMVFRSHHNKTAANLSFVENTKRAGSVVCSVPAQLSQLNYEKTGVWLETHFKFSRGVNLAGINIFKQQTMSFQNSDLVFTLLLVEKNLDGQTQFHQNCENSAMHRFGIGKNVPSTEQTGFLDVLFDTPILLNPEKQYILCIAIMEVSVGGLGKTDIKPWKIVNDNGVRQTADEQTYKRHTVNGVISYPRSTDITSLLTV